MFRFTNLTPVYEKDGAIIEYRASVDNGSADGNSVSAEVCKQKLRETVE